MQIKFLNIYNSYTEPLQVQYELLGFWQKSIVNDQINFIYKAAIEFKDYTFADYPDQDKLIKELRKSIVSGYDANTESHFWIVNRKQYNNFDELYKDLAQTHRLMELIITPEEE